MSASAPDPADQPWGSRPITQADAARFVQAAALPSEDRPTIAKNLAVFPPDIAVRGLFFEGVFRTLQERVGASAVTELRHLAALPEHIVPFRQYPHRDFYKLYYLTAARLHPSVPVPAALRRVAQSFFPIFRGSILGKTMSALMGDEPDTILPLLSKAYNLSVSGNEHDSEMTGQRELTWKCRVEPVEWFEQTFWGIIEGTMRPYERSGLKITTRRKSNEGDAMRYEFVIRW